MLENLRHQQRLFIPKNADQLSYANAEILYREQNNTIIVDSIVVDEVMRGQGIAGKLMEVIISKAKIEGKKIYPICPYAISYLEKKPELSSIVTKTL